MREIKFRAWDKRKEVMREVAVLHFNKLTKKVSGIEYWTGELSLKSIHANYINVMQYTGLKDKNGVEIYEGDIVSTCISDVEGEARWGRIIMKNPFEYSTEEALYIIHADELEVIGNIYENPELLEVQNG